MKSESREESREYGVFSTTLIVAAVLAGVFLIWIGHFLLIWLELDDIEAMKNIYKISMTLISFGGMLSSGVLIGGGVVNKSIDKFVRLGMLIAAALILMQMVSFSFAFQWQVY